MGAGPVAEREAHASWCFPVSLSLGARRWGSGFRGRGGQTAAPPPTPFPLTPERSPRFPEPAGGIRSLRQERPLDPYPRPLHGGTLGPRTLCCRSLRDSGSGETPCAHDWEPRGGRGSGPACRGGCVGAATAGVPSARLGGRRPACLPRAGSRGRGEASAWCGWAGRARGRVRACSPAPSALRSPPRGWGAASPTGSSRDPGAPASRARPGASAGYSAGLLTGRPGRAPLGVTLHPPGPDPSPPRARDLQAPHLDPEAPPTAHGEGSGTQDAQDGTREVAAGVGGLSRVQGRRLPGGGDLGRQCPAAFQHTPRGALGEEARRLAI